jgi:peptidyl-tRNA hydrolase
MDPADYVLEPLRKAEWVALEECIPTAAQAVFSVLERGLDYSMQEFNRE